MAYFTSLWKARIIEKYRQEYENEKINSLLTSNTKIPKKTIMQRWRFYGQNTKRRMTGRLKQWFPDGSSVSNLYFYLKSDHALPSFVLKSLIGFIGGIVLTYLCFIFFVYQLSISLIHATIMSSIIGVLLTLGLAFSWRIRCLVFLLIPQLFSRVGRYTLTCYALVLILTGPATNTLRNSEVLTESMACSQEQIKTNVRHITETVKKPFNAMKESIKLMVDGIKLVASKINNILLKVNGVITSFADIIQSSYSWLSSVVDICNQKFGTPYEHCLNAINRGIKNCRRTLGKDMAWICNDSAAKVACLNLKSYNSICTVADYATASFAATLKRRLRNFMTRINTTFSVDVQIHHVYSFSSNDSSTPSQVTAGIVTEIRKRADPLLTWLSWSSYVTSLFFLLIIFRAKYYQHMFETRSRFDNRYVTKELRELDFKRYQEKRETVLPLNRREQAKYICTSSFRLVSSEKVYLTRSIVFMAITTFKLLIHIVADYSLYWILMMMRYHGKHQTPLSHGPLDAGVQVLGSGLVADFIRSLIKSITSPLLSQKPSVSCLPKPYPPDLQRYLQVGILIILLWFFALFEPYGLRFRHVIMGHYQPERAKTRAVWLYNHILKTRGSFMKLARRKLHREYKYSSHENQTFGYWLNSIIPCWCLRYVFGTLLHEPNCLLCKTFEEPNDSDTKLSSCETTTCPGVYCVRCFYDIGRLCTICLSPKDYGDLSDVSLEKGSSDESDDSDINGPNSYLTESIEQRKLKGTERERLLKKPKSEKGTDSKFMIRKTKSKDSDASLPQSNRKLDKDQRNSYNSVSIESTSLTRNDFINEEENTSANNNSLISKYIDLCNDTTIATLNTNYQNCKEGYKIISFNSESKTDTKKDQSKRKNERNLRYRNILHRKSKSRIYTKLEIRKSQFKYFYATLLNVVINLKPSHISGCILNSFKTKTDEKSIKSNVPNRRKKHCKYFRMKFSTNKIRRSKIKRKTTNNNNKKSRRNKNASFTEKNIHNSNSMGNREVSNFCNSTTNFHEGENDVKKIREDRIPKHSKNHKELVKNKHSQSKKGFRGFCSCCITSLKSLSPSRHLFDALKRNSCAMLYNKANFKRRKKFTKTDAIDKTKNVTKETNARNYRLSSYILDQDWFKDTNNIVPRNEADNEKNPNKYKTQENIIYEVSSGLTDSKLSRRINYYKSLGIGDFDRFKENRPSIVLQESEKSIKMPVNSPTTKSSNDNFSKINIDKSISIKSLNIKDIKLAISKQFIHLRIRNPLPMLKDLYSAAMTTSTSEKERTKNANNTAEKGVMALPSVRSFSCQNILDKPLKDHTTQTDTNKINEDKKKKFSLRTRRDFQDDDMKNSCPCATHHGKFSTDKSCSCDHLNVNRAEKGVTASSVVRSFSGQNILNKPSKDHTTQTDTNKINKDKKKILPLRMREDFEDDDMNSCPCATHHGKFSADKSCSCDHLNVNRDFEDVSKQNTCTCATQYRNINNDKSCSCKHLYLTREFGDTETVEETSSSDISSSYTRSATYASQSEDTKTDTTVCSRLVVDYEESPKRVKLKSNKRRVKVNVITKSNKSTLTDKKDICDVSTITKDWWSPIVQRKVKKDLRRKESNGINKRKRRIKVDKSVETDGKVVKFRSIAQIIPPGIKDILSPSRYLLESQKYYNELYLTKVCSPRVQPIKTKEGNKRRLK